MFARLPPGVHSAAVDDVIVLNADERWTPARMVASIGAALGAAGGGVTLTLVSDATRTLGG